MAPQAQALLAQGDEAAYLRLLAQLRDAVDRFFNEVMVNAEDPKVRQNRLGLLKMLQNLMNQVADLSRLAT
jgi:glycyl-tRNA synthetase beta chain